MIADSRTSIIQVITSPLGFFALSLLTVEGFLGITLIYSKLTPESQFWGMMVGAVMFVIVVAIVSLLVAFIPKNLTYGEHGHLLDEGKIPYGENGELATKAQIEKQPKTEAK